MVGKIQQGEVILSYIEVATPFTLGDIKADYDAFYLANARGIDRIEMWPHQHDWVLKRLRPLSGISDDFKAGRKLWGIPIVLWEP